MFQKLNTAFKGMLKDTLFAALDFFKYMVITGIIVFLITRLLCPIAYVPTSSMEGEIPTESFVFCLKTSYWGDKSPERGDVILFNRSESTDDKNIYTKRVVGLPGEIIVIEDGKTYINGELYEETWLKEEPEKLDFGPFEVPAGQYFCMGDNRNASYDCRYWAEHFIEEENVIAKCIFVISSQKVGPIDDHH